MRDLESLSAHQAVRALARREINAQGLLLACLDRIGQRDSVVRAWSSFGKENALVRAKSLDKGQELGPYPHQAIVFPPLRPSNASRSKAKCGQCGYEVTLLKKWARYGAPICPKDNIRMQEDIPETIENTENYNSDSVDKGLKPSRDEIQRAIS
ncbi:hypothetical protein [Polynucleobacter necessarius]|uniref:hypothetical protein n=1 Tax=Polynucleobacter necessarius TaxID=576610 RepID=UPI0018D5932E|nr:hypothetical protein [Polynucleobacter necessarius]